MEGGEAVVVVAASGEGAGGSARGGEGGGGGRVGSEPWEEVGRVKKQDLHAWDAEDLACLCL